MALEDYLQSLGQNEAESERGEFTISAERAKALLAGKALSDVWMAWLCLAQGFIASGASSMEMDCTNRSVTWKIDFPEPLSLLDLLREDRFLLGWLNLGWFGTPHWDADQSTLTVPWQGHAWKRYRFASTFPQTMETALKYAPIPVRIGIHSIALRYLPSADPMCLYPLPDGRPGGMVFEDAHAETHSFFERRRFPLPGRDESDSNFAEPILAAFARRTKSSWSEVTWVSQGVVIGTERNTLERPRIAVVASVEACGLETDLSGFQVVRNPPHHRFVIALKRDVLWML